MPSPQSDVMLSEAKHLARSEITPPTKFPSVILSEVGLREAQANEVERPRVPIPAAEASGNSHCALDSFTHQLIRAAYWLSAEC